MQIFKTKSIFNFPFIWFKSINKIRKKLLLVFLFVSLLPTLLIGGYALLFTTDTLHKNSLSIHSAKVDLISEKILNYLEQVNSDLFYLRDFNAMNLYLSALTSDSAHKKRLMLTNLRSSFNKFAKQKKKYKQIRFIHTEELGIVGIGYDAGKIHNITDSDLQKIKESAHFQNAAALDKDELLLTVLNLSEQGGNISKQLRPIINYATPVFNDANELQGVVSLDVSLKRIMNILAGETKADTQIQFVNPEGFYYFQAAENGLNSNVNLFTEKKGLQELIRNSPSGSLDLGNDIITYRVIKMVANKLDLGVILDITPKSEVFKAENNFLYIFISVFFLALILTIMLAIIFSNSITKPLIALTNDVDRLSKGELETPIVLESADETGTLAIAIERLRKSIKILMKRAR